MLSLLSDSNKNHILPSNKDINKLILQTDFNNEIINGLQQGLQLFDPQTDISLLKNVNTSNIKNIDFDKINNNFKPLNKEGLNIGINKINNNINETYDNVLLYIDELKDKFKQPIYIIGIIILILLLKK